MTPYEQMVEDIAGFTHDPLGFVLYAFEWGVGELSAYPNGPEPWQREQLERIGAQLKAGAGIGAVVQEAVSSGHGIGKSAQVSWLILWAMSTHENTRGVVTANTDVQLRTKTWAELAKWYRLCICKDWFKLTATALASADPAHERTWRIDIIPWSLENTEAFAGLHNKGNRIIVIYDEASSIETPIFEVTEGALTDSNTEIIWCIYGNPTRTTGAFYEAAFGKSRHRWNSMQIDSRTVSLTNKAKIQQWIDDEGEDSDFVRVRVRGLPPRSSMIEFIGSADIERCVAYKAVGYEKEPRVLGMDCARFGDDYNVIYCKQGRKTWFVRKWRGLDTQQSAAYLVEAFNELGANVAFVDGGGCGGGVVDRGRMLLGNHKVVEVGFGESAQDSTRYANKRAELWGNLRDAMRAGIQIDNNMELRTDLLGPTYKFTNKQQIQLERKEDMKKRGLSSPDHADALALCFTYPVTADSERVEKGTYSPFTARLDLQ